MNIYPLNLQLYIPIREVGGKSRCLCVKFVVDGMLGRLVRWIRILGYDTLYLAHTDDESLLNTATSEKRVLLTMDAELYNKSILREIDAHLVKSVDRLEQLVDVATRFGLSLEVDTKTSRCPICNSSLDEIPQHEVEGKIPFSSFVQNKEFWRCVGCGKIYWQGSHWKNIRAQLTYARELSVHK
jgi:uncharacterized protein with PIN domain